MNTKSRMLSLIIAIALVFSTISTVGFAATYSDIDSSKSYSSAVSLLSALKLLKGYEDGTFKPDGDITRAEFAAVVVRALGQEDSATSAKGTSAFNDVAADFWGSGYISVASNLKVINGFGDGNFGPEQNVTYEQAVKMMVCAIGYEPLALGAVGNDATQVWPKGYLAAATQLNMVSGVQGVEGTPAKRWQVARLVYNSLEIKLMEKVVSLTGDVKYERKDKTLLKDCLKIENSTGEVKANTNTSVSSSVSKTRNGDVLIYDNDENEEVTYKDGGLSTDSMIGHSIKFYYTKTDDDVRTLVFVEDKTNSSDIVKIDATNIDNVEGSYSNGFTISYWENKETSTKTVKAEVAKNASVSINGRPVNIPTKVDLMPVSGTVELIDSTGAGSFDKVLVTSYETYVVKSINSTGKEVVDKYRTINENNTLKIDEDDNSIDVTIKNTSGSSLTFSNIAVWNVLSVKQSNGASKNTMEVTISNKMIQGTITEVDDEDSISIDNKKYEISPYYLKYATKADGYEAFEVDLSGKFYLDKDDKIAAFDKTAAANSYYAYLRRAEYINDTLSLEMFTQSQSGDDLAILKCASKVKIDGNSISGDKALDKLKESFKNDYINSDSEDDNFGNNFVPQLIRYSVNSSNQVNVIETVEGKGLKVLDVGYTNDVDKNVMKYSSSNYQFAGSNGKFMINSSTYVFVVPTVRTNDEYYARYTGTSFFENNKPYSVEAFDTVGDFNTAKAVVVYISESFFEPTAKSPVAFISNIKATTSSGNSDYNREITAYVITQGSGTQEPVKLYAKAEAIDAENLHVGDVFRYTTTSSGYIRTESVKNVYDISGNMELVNTKAEYTDATEFRFYSGYLYAASENSIEIAYANKTTDIESATKETFSTNSNALTFVYDDSKSGSTTDPKFVKDNISLESRPSYTKAPDKTPAEVFVFKFGSAVRAVYVIDKRAQ